MTKVTPSDVLRLSGLFDSCNILNLHSFVGRIRRSRRIRREQITLFAQTIMCKLLLFPEIIENGNWRTAFMFGFQIPVLYCSGDLFRYVFPSDSRRYCHRSRRVPLHLAEKGDHLPDRPLALSYKGVPGNLMPPVTVYPDVC